MGNTWSRDGEMQECNLQAYHGSCKLSDVQDSHRGFLKKKTSSDSNAQIDKTFNLAAGTEVVPLLERSPSLPALEGCYHGKHQGRTFQM